MKKKMAFILPVILICASLAACTSGSTANSNDTSASVSTSISISTSSETIVSADTSTSEETEISNGTSISEPEPVETVETRSIAVYFGNLCDVSVMVSYQDPVSKEQVDTGYVLAKGESLKIPFDNWRSQDEILAIAVYSEGGELLQVSTIDMTVVTSYIQIVFTGEGKYEGFSIYEYE